MIKKTKCLAVLVSLAVAIAFEGNAFAQPSGGVLYSLLMDVSTSPYTHALEAVDLATHSHIKTINLGAGYVASFAVSPDQSKIYVARYMEADGSAGTGVDVYDDAGVLIQKISTDVPVYDLVLSQDGAALYATSEMGVHKIDTVANAVVRSYESFNEFIPAVSISPDGSKVAFTSNSSGEVSVVRASDMALLFSIGLTDQNGSQLLPGDSRFMSNDRLLVWDSYSSSLCQVDVLTSNQSVSQTIALGGLGVASGPNLLDVEPLTGMAFALSLVSGPNNSLSGGIAVMNTATGASSILGVSGFDFLVPKVSRADSSLYIGASVYPWDMSKKATLSRYDISSGVLTNGIYTFEAPGLVYDVQIIEPPRDMTPPETQIRSAVDGNGSVVPNGGSTPSTALAVSFSGSDDAGLAEFQQCSLDGAPYIACTSPVSLSGLVTGPHTLLVRAVDLVRNIDPTPAMFSWTVLTPTQACELLLGEVSAEPSLSAPLRQTLTLLSDANTSNDAAACGKLDAFLGQIAAKERSGKPTTTDVAQLRSQTQAIKLAQGCP